jgi:hypothetical protein
MEEQAADQETQIMKMESEDDKALVVFLQTYAPHVPDAPSELEDSIFSEVKLRSQRKQRQRISRRLVLVGLMSASVLGFLLLKENNKDNLEPLEEYMEESWAGVNGLQEDIGFQTMLAEVDRGFQRSE